MNADPDWRGACLNTDGCAHPVRSDSVCLGSGLRICICDKLSSDAEAAGPGTTHGGPQAQKMLVVLQTCLSELPHPERR